MRVNKGTEAAIRLRDFRGETGQYFLGRLVVRVPGLAKLG